MIDQAVAAFAGARAQTIAAVTPLSQAQLDFSPRRGSWSIGECADHLVLAEALYRGEIERLVEMARRGERPYLKRTFADVNVAPLHLPNQMLSMFAAPVAMMSRMLPQAVRSVATEFPLLPTRNPDVATPRPQLPAAQLRASLSQSLADTRAVIANNADLDFTGMISEHPLTGVTNVVQIFGFFALHERRHQSQMERVRKDPRFPR